MSRRCVPAHFSMLRRPVRAYVAPRPGERRADGRMILPTWMLGDAGAATVGHRPYRRLAARGSRARMRPRAGDRASVDGWRGVRAAEGAGFENQCAGNRTAGSNPALSDPYRNGRSPGRAGRVRFTRLEDVRRRIDRSVSVRLWEDSAFLVDALQPGKRQDERGRSPIHPQLPGLLADAVIGAGDFLAQLEIHLVQIPELAAFVL